MKACVSCVYVLGGVCVISNIKCFVINSYTSYTNKYLNLVDHVDLFILQSRLNKCLIEFAQIKNIALVYANSNILCI